MSEEDFSYIDPMEPYTMKDINLMIDKYETLLLKEPDNLYYQYEIQYHKQLQDSLKEKQREASNRSYEKNREKHLEIKRDYGMRYYHKKKEEKALDVKKKEPSEWNKFVKENYSLVSHLPYKERLKALSEMRKGV